MHELDNGRTRFRRLVAGAISVEPALPLVHGTDTFRFLDAVEAQRLEPQACDTFKGESLLYFFYGRPSFRVNPDAEPASLMHYLPVLFILKPGEQLNIRRIFPFDSGAFQRAFYSAYLHKGMRLGDFGLDVDPATPGKVIGAFFGDAPSYLRADPGSVRAPAPEELEAASYRTIVSARDANSIDSRGAAIEIQTGEPVPLAGAVHAVILPAPFVEKGTTGSKLASLDIKAIPYMVHGRTRPGEYVTTITDLCYRFYVDLGLFQAGEIDADS